MTLHTAKGLEYEAVFLTGLEEGLLPHRMSFVTPGGMAEERRLFYVGITRARKKLHLSLAMSRTTFGETESASPSRYLQEIPGELIDWRESGANRQMESSRYRESIAETTSKEKKVWSGAISSVRNNKGLQLAIGDMIEHSDFGRGKVIATAGEGARQTAEVHFGSVGTKRLLVKVAPIQKV
jgi:DNA helicase-2/ATP-dependent DNA helicase PcrA